LPAGSAQSFEVVGLDFNTMYYFAIKAFDEFNNSGPTSNVPTGTTLGVPDITAAPTSFSADLISGATDTQTLVLTNDGEGTLDFTVPARTCCSVLRSCSSRFLRKANRPKSGAPGERRRPDPAIAGSTATAGSPTSLGGRKA
jgi:hypothetical protein